LLAWCSFALAASDVQTFALTDTKDLVLRNVQANAIEYKGRKAVRLTKDTEKDGFALLQRTDFQDGTIEADIALKITTPPTIRMPGFVGIAFRVRPDASAYESFTCGREIRAQTIRRCGTIPCNTSPSRTSTGTNYAGSGLGSTKHTLT
jgi:hypothetical protein